MLRNYTFEPNDRFVIDGVVHEVVAEYTVFNSGKVCSAAGQALGFDLPLIRKDVAGGETVLIRAERIVAEMDHPGFDKGLKFIYPGDENHFENKGVLSTIIDRRSGQRENFDATLWFKSVGRDQIEALHCTGYGGPRATAMLGDFFRNKNPRLASFFYPNSTAEITLNKNLVEGHLHKVAPVTTGKLFKLSKEDMILAKAGIGSGRAA